MGVFHDGEKAVQALVKEKERAKQIGKNIVASLPLGVNSFIEEQSFIVASSIAKDGSVWVSNLLAAPGAVSISDQDSVSIDIAKLYLHKRDIFSCNVFVGAKIGLLFIDLGTRRRYRINGTISFLETGVLVIGIDQCYGNCPKFIQKRVGVFQSLNHVDSVVKGSILNDVVKNVISSSDTFFVGSSSKVGDLDVSHRGGPRGFVKVSGNKLRIPDYQGNSLYNTLGNIHSNPKAGLLFIDFEAGFFVQLSGQAKLDFENPKDENTTGTGRYWNFCPDSWSMFSIPVNISWELIESSPFNPKF